MNTGKYRLFTACASPYRHTLSFLLRKSTSLYNRREAKILTTVASLFTSSYVFNWSKYLPDTPLKYCPSFDGRIVLYPSANVVRDYFSWRQADSSCLLSVRAKQCAHRSVAAHINNLYNTVFWALVLKGGQSTTEAHATLRVRRACGRIVAISDVHVRLEQGTVSSQKHEMLFSRFGINYNELPARFRKGSVLVREEVR